MSKDESNEGPVGVRELLVMEISYVHKKMCGWGRDGNHREKMKQRKKPSLSGKAKQAEKQNETAAKLCIEKFPCLTVFQSANTHRETERNNSETVSQQYPETCYLSVRLKPNKQKQNETVAKQQQPYGHMSSLTVSNSPSKPLLRCRHTCLTNCGHPSANNRTALFRHERNNALHANCNAECPVEQNKRGASKKKLEQQKEKQKRNKRTRFTRSEVPKIMMIPVMIVLMIV